VPTCVSGSSGRLIASSVRSFARTPASARPRVLHRSGPRVRARASRCRAARSRSQDGPRQTGLQAIDDQRDGAVATRHDDQVSAVAHRIGDGRSRFRPHCPSPRSRGAGGRCPRTRRPTRSERGPIARGFTGLRRRRSNASGDLGASRNSTTRLAAALC
jgi:hypothetical protein